ncbi:hypothetical protein SUGI_0106810 [Cryptomeria japonica]|nr:hypothetical protein SUGI_0106810 [Cryptomeria japonica]
MSTCGTSSEENRRSKVFSRRDKQSHNVSHVARHAIRNKAIRPNGKKVGRPTTVKGFTGGYEKGKILSNWSNWFLF